MGVELKRKQHTEALMGMAQELLEELHDAADKQDYVEIAKQLRRAMQIWDVLYKPADALFNEDRAVVTRFWRACYSMPEQEIRKEAVRLYAFFIGADCDFAFAPLIVMANAECDRLLKVSGDLLAEFRSVRKVVPLRKGGPALTVIVNSPSK